MIDLSFVTSHLPHLDPVSLLVGALGSHVIVAAAVKAVRPIPALIVGKLKARVQALASSGKIDAPTMKLLRSYARATFVFIDEEMPDRPGPEKMAAALDRLAAVPYLGVLVRADRAGAQEILQAAYDSVKAEAKAEGAAQ